VAPGTIDSDGLKKYPKMMQEMLLQEINHNYCYRKGKCQDISNAVCFLLSDGASFITGQTLQVDGGEAIVNIKIPPAKPFQVKCKL
jgi:citronellol/citronellal dehydrogenase